MKEAVMPLTSKHLSSVKESVLVTSVKDSVLPHVAGAVHTLDNMACGGLDHLKVKRSVKNVSAIIQGGLLTWVTW
jgi:hypothetical protein